MMRFTQEGPLWRRALIAAAAMVGASAAFVGVFMLILTVFVDRAVAPAAPTIDTDTAAAHEQPSKPAQNGKTSAAAPIETGDRS